ncbi:MAG: S-adenosylmethionine:tRNA ribosyltransferase-isomerase [Micromonosporaceae bacterium]|nr:S-adenosylmethionine:tRNA ribosyltransferase-isomerase [Micromonosporaceae bacterium]
MIATLPRRPSTRFTLPDELSASGPPEALGLARDEVRLLVADERATTHARFRELQRFLTPGDLLVVNTSRTVPAAVDATRESNGAPVVVHVSTTLADGDHVVELRSAPDASRPVLDATPGERLRLASDRPPKHPATTLTLLSPYPRDSDRNRLWRARAAGDLKDLLARAGRPVRYGYVTDRWPLADYQTVFATEAHAAPGSGPDGSAEMPSAGRPFSAELVTRLVSRGVLMAPITLHTGVSSQDSGEPPLAEWFQVPESTAALVNWARERGRRVIAVGTTATRALESAAGPDGLVTAAEGWTDLVLSPERPARTVDALLTGLHAPEASHLLLLEAVAGPELTQRVYDAALDRRYLWHEFGDVSLLLPDRP